MYICVNNTLLLNICKTIAFLEILLKSVQITTKMSKNACSKNFEKFNFCQFLRYDNMVWDWTRYILWACFKHYIMGLNTILQKPPGRFVASWKVPYFEDFSNFNAKFHNFSQHLLTKIFMSSKSMKSPLQNPIFRFFISLMLAEIS